MNYLTHYYKNLSEELQNELNLLQFHLNEIATQEEKVVSNQTPQPESISGVGDEAGIGRWLRPDPKPGAPGRKPRFGPGADDIRPVPGQRYRFPHGFNEPRPAKRPSHAPSGTPYPNNPPLVHPNGTIIAREGGGVFSIGGTYFWRDADGTVFVWSPSQGVWVPGNPPVHPWQ